MKTEWRLKFFDDLSPHELYALLRLRSEVFVVEQTCVFLDMDDKDQGAHHLLGYRNGELVACTRLLPPGLTYADASIGRVVTSSAVRRSGLGRELMTRSIEEAYTLFGHVPLKLGAQLYLKGFYESFGFLQSGPGYLEDGIPHIPMVRVTS